VPRWPAGPGRGTGQPRAHPRPHARHPHLRGAPRPAREPRLQVRAHVDPAGFGEPAPGVHARLMPTRVVQWTTGNVGKRAVRAIASNPDLELVGCYAWSDDKVGRDAGELAGIAAVGVAATNDVDALLALKPDCVVYTPMWSDIDEL